MTALSAPRNLVELASTPGFPVGVAAGVTIHQGALIIAAAGVGRPGRAGQGGNDTAKANDASTYKCLGIAQESVVGGASDGDVKVRVKAGVFNLVNSAGVDAIGADDVGRPCYIVDDQTVAATSAGGTRAQAGVVAFIDSEGVWVSAGVTVADTRRAVVVPFFINETDTLAPTNAELISPVRGEIIAASAIVQKAVTTGGDITFLVGATAVDGLTITIADGATKGTVATDRPTAGHASTLVNQGDRLQVAPGAAFNTAGAVSGHLLIAF